MAELRAVPADDTDDTDDTDSGDDPRDHDTALDHAAPDHAAGYTLAQLAEASGVPERTIRFYRQSGLIEVPQRVGRRAYYAPDQLARVRLIAELRDHGLGLEAIRDLLHDPAGRPHGLARVLSITDELRSPWIDDGATRMTETEVLRELGVDEPDLLAELERFGLIMRNPGTRARTYTVPSLRTLQLAGRTINAGVDAALALESWRTMQDHLADMSTELVELYARHTGRGFAGAGSGPELRRSMAELQPIGLLAVQLFFAHAIENALDAFIERGGLLEVNRRLPGNDDAGADADTHDAGTDDGSS